jgi:hypothetical protein
LNFELIYTEISWKRINLHIHHGPKFDRPNSGFTFGHEGKPGSDALHRTVAVAPINPVVAGDRGGGKAD